MYNKYAPYNTDTAVISDGTTVKVGGKVWFKKDVEGKGFVREIICRPHMMGTQVELVLGACRNKKQGDMYRWHPEADTYARSVKTGKAYREAVVFVYPDQCWKA